MRCCPNIWLIALLLSVVFSAIRGGFDPQDVQNLIDTDSYLRYLTVQKLLNGDGWYDHLVARDNWPYGLEHHWTRLPDLLLLPLAFIFSPLMMGAVYQTLLLALFAVGLIKAAEKFQASWSNLVNPALLLAVFSSPYLLSYFTPGRIDHHALLATLFVWLLYALLRQRWMQVGVLAGLGVWVSIEFFVPLAFITLWLGICWLKNPAAYHRAPWQFFWPMLLVMTLAIPLERPPAEFTHPIIDTLSFPHWLLILLTTLSAWILSLPAAWQCAWPWRLLKAVLYVTGIFLITFLAFPSLLQLGFSPTDDPLLAQYFSEYIDELQSPFSKGYGLSPFIAALFGLALAYPSLRQQHWPTGGLLLLWLTLALSLLMAIAFRWSYYAIPAALLLLAFGLSHPLWEKRRLHRMAIIFTLVLLPPLIAAQPIRESQHEEGELGICLKEIHQLIHENLLGDTPLTVAIIPNQGYEMLFYTPHHILAANNHRNVHGLGDLLRLLNTRDAALAEAIARKRQVQVIVECSPLISDSSYLHLPQNWLQPHPLSGNFKELKIWEVKSPVSVARRMP